MNSCFVGCIMNIIKRKIINTMQRRPWTAYEDQILKNLFEKVKLNKWSHIARRMQEQYQLAPRTGKQCRQRYNNHLNPLMMKENWTELQESNLFRLHDQLGNKWAIIAAKLGGRTDNSVKNHFFAKLRKSMRKINKIISDNYKKQLKQIKLNVLYKIIEASEQRFKKSPLCTFETSKYSCSLKNKILMFAYQSIKQPQKGDFQQLIKEIHDFGKNYKRKPKQLRRVASQGIQLPEELISYPAKQVENEIENQAKSQSENEQDSEDQIVRQPLQLWKTFEEVNAIEVASDKMNLRSRPFLQQKKVNHVQELLHNQGLLEQEVDEFPPIPGMMKHNTSSEFLMQGQSQSHQVFYLDQSQGNGHQLPPPMHFNQILKKQSQSEQLFS